jgi:hypothetical protein
MIELSTRPARPRNILPGRLERLTQAFPGAADRALEELGVAQVSEASLAHQIVQALNKIEFEIGLQAGCAAGMED